MPGSSFAASARRDASISVVVPFYQGQAWLERALRSIERQTLQPREIVLVDDGSPEPLRVDVRAENVATPVRVVRHPRNRGIPAARNSGVKAASSEWIAFLDQDDEWTPDKLERQWHCLQGEADPERTLVFGRCLVAPEAALEGGRLFPSAAAIARIGDGSRGTAGELMLRGNVVPFITLLVHRSVFERYGALDETLTGGSDDYEFVLRLAAEGLSFRCADPPHEAGRYSAVHYLTGRNYSDPERFFANEVALLQVLCDRYPTLAPLYERSLARAHYRLARAYDGAGVPRRALEHHRTARALDPYWLAPWAAVAIHHAPSPLADWLAAGRGIARRLRGGP
ncbi:MAG: glycosyltransferase family 2 protein [Gemmatimonadetes bacterium]|nr:glycosyltransferase family 2 protein [Gemmatimonadota bacterium]